MVKTRILLAGCAALTSHVAMAADRPSFVAAEALQTRPEAGGGATPDPARATSIDQAGDTGIQDIVVTARRQSESLQNVPVAISAITGDSLAKQGITNSFALSNVIPNLQVTSAYGNSQPNYTLRGVGVGNEFNSNAASPIGVYVDEVYQSFRASHGIQLYDLERVEVVRGPQGTLYGRNTTGGAVNFITRQPLLSGTSGYVTAGYGNLKHSTAMGAIDTTLVEDKLGVRIAGTFEHYQPYIHNLLGPDASGGNDYGVRGTVRFKPSTDVDVVLKGYTGKHKGVQQPLFATNASPGDVGPITYGGVGPAFGLVYDRHALPFRTVEIPDIGRTSTESSGVSLRAVVKASERLTVTSVSGYDAGSYLNGTRAQNSRFGFGDCEGTPVNICEVAFQSHYKAFNQEVRANYDVERLKLIGGVYYGWDRIKANNGANLYGFLNDIRKAVGLPATYFNPIGFGLNPNPAALPTPISAINTYTQKRDSKAVFGEGIYDLTDKLSLTLGLRYTKDKIKYLDGIAYLMDDTGARRLITVSTSPTPVLPGTETPINLRSNSTALTGRLIVSYKPSDESLVYTSYSRGYRSGTYNGLALQSSSQVSFVKPEKVNAFEAGFKTRFLNNALQFNGALFYYDYKDQQVSQIIGQGITSLTGIDGTVKGLEFDLTYKASRALQVYLSGGALKTRYKKGEALSGIPVNGNKFTAAPDFSLSGGFDWTVAEIGAGSVSLHGDGSYTGKFAFDPFGDRQATGILTEGGGDYWLFNARLSYNLERSTISGWIRNIGNENYFQYGQNTEAAFGTDNFSVNQPRTYGVEVTYRF